MSNSAFQPTSGAWYLLEFADLRRIDSDANTRVRIRVKDGSTADDAVIEGCQLALGLAANTHAQWRFDEVEPGWFTIVARHSGKVIDLDYASGAEGARFKQLTRHPANSPNGFAQQFSVSKVRGGFVLRCRASQKVVSGTEPDTTGICKIVQSQYDAKKSETVIITRYETPAFVPVPQTWYRVRFQHSNFLMDVLGSSTANGANVLQWREMLSPNQEWRLEQVEPGWYVLIARHSNQVLEVEGGSMSDGGNILQWPRHNGTNQQWAIRVVGGGYVLINRRSGKAASVTTAGIAEGATVYQQTLGKAGYAQAVDFEVAPGPALSPEVGYYYTLKSGSGSAGLAVEAGRVEDGAAVVLTQLTGQPFSQWRFDAVDPTYFVLTARHSGKVLAVNGTASTDGLRLIQTTNTGAQNQHWRLESSAFGLVLRNRQTGKVFDGMISINDGLIYACQMSSSGSASQALAAAVVALPDLKPRTDAYYSLTFAHSGKALSVGQGKQDVGAVVWQGNFISGGHQQFRFAAVEPGWYVITARHSGQVLDISDSSVADGAQLVQWTRTAGSTSQQWRLVSTPYGTVLVNRKSGKPIEVPADSLSHGALVKQGSPQWDQNQSLDAEVFVTDTVLATPTDSYVKPALAASPLGQTGGAPTGGTATAAATDSSSAPAAVVAASPLAANAFFVDYSVPFTFTGNVQTQTLSSGASYSGAAQIGAPFNTDSGSARVVCSTESGASKWTLIFDVPASKSLAATIDSEVLPKISDSTVRDVVAVTLKPFVALYTSTKVVLSPTKGSDPEVGSYGAGLTVFGSVPVSKIPPFDLLHQMFPGVRLDTRSLNLGLGTTPSPDPRKIEFWVSGGLTLNTDLIPGFLKLNTLGLKLSKSYSKATAAGELALTLKVPGEELALTGGVTTTTSGANSTTAVWAALDATDGMWENAFGIPGLNVAGMGVQLTQYVGKSGISNSFSVRGEVHLGSGLLGARVAIAINPTDSTRNILDVYSEEGISLPRLLQPLLGDLVDVSTVCDVALTNLQLYVAPKGGSIAGVNYPMGVTIGAKLSLWGWSLSALGVATKTSLSLNATADPLRLAAGGVTFLEFTSATDSTIGASFAFGVNAKQFGGSISARVSLLNGLRYGVLSGTVNTSGFRGKLLTGSEAAGLGMYESTEIVMEKGLFSLAYSPTLEAAVSISGYRASVSVSCAVKVAVSSTSFSQSVAFAFSAMGDNYTAGPFQVTVPFSDISDLAEHFYKSAADLITNKIVGELVQATTEAFNWVRSQVTQIVDDAGRFFRSIGADSGRVANGLKNVYNATAADFARVMSGTFSWTVNETGTFLKDAYGLGADTISDALRGAGYAKEEVSNLFKSWGGSFSKYAEDVIDYINPANWSWPW